MSVFSEALGAARVEARMTLAELGRRSGYSNTYVANLIAGRRPTPHAYVITRFAKALNVPYTQLMPEGGQLTIDGSEKRKREMERVPMRYNLLPPKPPGPKAPKMSEIEFGAYLKKQRIAAGYNTADKLSNRLNITSITIDRYEIGEAFATLYTLKKLEKLYGLPQYDLTDRGGFLIRDDDDEEMIAALEPVPVPVPEPEPVVPEPAPAPPSVVDNMINFVQAGQSKPLDICTELLEELVNARSKHPKAFSSAHEGYAILKEEMEELWDDIKRDDYENARKELVQVGAMVIRFLLDVELKPKNKPIWTRIFSKS